MSVLFLKTALDDKKHRLHGEVLLTQPISFLLVIATVTSILFIIFFYLYFSEYNRMETISGNIALESGITRSYPNHSGTIEKIHVKDGQKVKKGDTLFTIRVNTTLETGLDVNKSIIDEYESQYKLLNRKIELIKIVYEKSLSKKGHQKKLLENKVNSLSAQEEINREKQLLFKQKKDNFTRLLNKGHISKEESESLDELILEIKSEGEELSFRKQSIISALNELSADIELSPEKNSLLLLDLESEKSLLKQKISQSKVNSKYVLISSNDGVITGINVNEGEYVSQGQLLTSILPDNTELIAELLLPTKASGFIKRGDIVKLRLDAYPHQKYGTVQGKVSVIDSVLQESNSGLTKQNASYYRVKVTLDSDAINYHGQKLALNNGMSLQADILLENRTLISWIFDPLSNLFE